MISVRQESDLRIVRDMAGPPSIAQLEALGRLVRGGLLGGEQIALSLDPLRCDVGFYRETMAGPRPLPLN